MPTRSPPETSSSASANVTIRPRSSLESRAPLEANAIDERTVGPQPHGVGGLPFLLADIEMIVARRAAPVDVLRRLAGDEAAILPEALAGAGAAPAMQAMDDVGGDAAGFEHETGKRSGERSAFAIGTSDC